MWARSSRAALEAKIEMLQEQNADLKRQVSELTEALCAQTSPAFYQQKMMQRNAAVEASPEDEKKKEENKFIQRYIEEMDGPTFKDPREFIAYLERGGISSLESDLEMAATAAPDSPGSLHQNSES